jgi:nicotinate phosphoribosyltransferase
MRAGTLVEPLPSLPEIRIHASTQIAALPMRLLSLDLATSFPVVVAATLRELAQQVDARQQFLAQQDRARWSTN